MSSWCAPGIKEKYAAIESKHGLSDGTIKQLEEQIVVEKEKFVAVMKQKTEMQKKLLESEDALAVSEGKLLSEHAKLEGTLRVLTVY